MSIYLDSDLSIAKTLTIDGSGHRVAVSGDSGNDGSRNVRVFNIAAGSAVTLGHLSIISGTASADGGAPPPKPRRPSACFNSSLTA